MARRKPTRTVGDALDRPRTARERAAGAALAQAGKAGAAESAAALKAMERSTAAMLASLDTVIDRAIDLEMRRVGTRDFRMLAFHLSMERRKLLRAPMSALGSLRGRGRPSTADLQDAAAVEAVVALLKRSMSERSAVAHVARLKGLSPGKLRARVRKWRKNHP